jgi:hypothetical protein
LKFADVADRIAQGSVVPYLGLEIFAGSKRLPSNSDEIIFALNEGRAMSPRLMLEYPRAAMAIEQRRGRKKLEELFAAIYKNVFEPTPTHTALSKRAPQIVVDTNRDDTLQRMFEGEFTLVSGVARISGNLPRYKAWAKNAGGYQPIETDAINLEKPLLFKPFGVLEPQTELIVSDADFVDWLTEAMAGAAVPNALKERRRDLRWLFLGCSFQRDTDRMAASEIIGGESCGGGWWIVDREIESAESKFLSRHKIEAVICDLNEFLG